METLTWCFGLTVVLAASANPDRAGVTVKPTSRVKGQPREELTLSCGDGNESGAVQFWHTPFGDLTPGFHSPSDPVFLRRDGTLVVPSASVLHSGLYYCLLQGAEGITLWAYDLHVSRDDPENPGRGRHAGRVASRSRRDARSEAGGVSRGQFAGAVAASVLLTFVVGFSAGALSRAQVIRCLGAVAKRLRLARKQHSQTESTPDRRYVVATKSLEAVHDNEAFKGEQAWDKTSVQSQALNTTISSTSSSPPPAKPKRSFRVREQEEQDSAAHVEGCDREKEEARTTKEEDEEEEEETQHHSVEEQKEDDGRGSREGKRHREGEGRREEETGGEEETQREEEEGEGKAESSSDEEEETDAQKQENATKTTKNYKDGRTPAISRPGRRVIRLYQYDDEGQLYSHLQDPAPDELSPAPRLKPRAVSLTRLNAIMAAASAGPMDTRETESEDGAARPHFHMDI